VAEWRGSVANTGGAAVSLPFHGAGTSGEWRRQVTRASGAASEGKGEKARAKGNGGWSALLRSEAERCGAERSAAGGR
jgi:hypothetical protein